MIDRGRKKSGWRIAVAVAVVALALLACGLSIALAMRKVAAEKKVERKFATEETMAKPTPKFPPLEQQPDNN